ncbi:MAG: lipocalin family protein [Sulfuricurvum sp.]|nr:lipocalin family protein [Sulfuricurvum sp.]
MLQRLLLIIGTIFISGCSHTTVHLDTVSSVDLNRYAGKWYEIARYENTFERGCVGATADYTSLDGSIDVTNRCYDSLGKMTGEAKGSAKVVPESANSKLKVSFFWPFYGDYWVIKLADDYRYSVVGDPSRKYLWILARTPKLNESDRQAILTELPKFGYDADKLYWTSYSGLTKE